MGQMTPLEEMFCILTEPISIENVYMLYRLSDLHPEVKQPFYNSPHFARWCWENHHWLQVNITLAVRLDMRVRLAKEKAGQ